MSYDGENVFSEEYGYFSYPLFILVKRDSLTRKVCVTVSSTSVSKLTQWKTLAHFSETLGNTPRRTFLPVLFLISFFMSLFVRYSEPLLSTKGKSVSKCF